MLTNLLRAGYPAILVLTHEIHRAEEVLKVDGWHFYAWDCIRGTRDLANNTLTNDIRDPVEALAFLDNNRDTVLIAHNLHLFLNIPEVIQAIQNGVTKWKSLGCCLVLLAPSITLGPELEKIFHVVDLPFPSVLQLFAMQQQLAEDITKIQDVAIEADLTAARAARGLTEFEAETAFALSLIEVSRFEPKIINEAKAQTLRKSGLMDVWEPVDIQEVGGLANLKAYITSRARAFQQGNEHLPKPKGILLTGVSGTGKSLSCKATASILGWPLIRLDIGALKNSLLGESERRMRQATQIIDAFGEAVIWLDEVEKAFAGIQNSGQTDAGTSASMFGLFLTWMQETKSPIMVMATANNISQLPPEFLRAGRFDAIFFVDLPTRLERLEIIEIMNRRYATQISCDEEFSGFTGAEIEQVTKDSMFEGFHSAMSNLIPVSKLMNEEISALRKWASTRARVANTPEEYTQESRRVRLAQGTS
jgi:AAA+ superfamily predicted ATPase